MGCSINKPFMGAERCLTKKTNRRNEKFLDWDAGPDVGLLRRIV